MSRNVLILFLFLLAGCGGSDIEYNYIDENNGIQWSEKVFESVRSTRKYELCDNLSENGNSDFVLPTIEQLETLVKNCTKTDGCEKAEDGRYSVFDDIGRFWSSSYEYDGDDTIAKSPVPLPIYLDFNIGTKSTEMTPGNSYYKVRCVREM